MQRISRPPAVRRISQQFRAQEGRERVAEAPTTKPKKKPAQDAPTLVYVGTRTGPTSKGIYVFRLQTSNLEVSQNITLAPLGLAAEVPDPTYLELDLERRLLFAVSEVGPPRVMGGGTVSAYAVEPEGTLKLLDRRPSMGNDPCHLVLDRAGRRLLVANASGSLALFPVSADGRLGEASDVAKLPGKPADPARARWGRVGGVALDVGQRFAFACDPAADQLWRFRLDGGKLVPGTPPSTAAKAGSAPRRPLFRPDGHFAYVVNQKDSTISVFAYDEKTGDLKEVQSISTVPPYFDGKNYPAELGIHPSGKFLYVSNCGHNSVVLFTVDAEKGTLTYVEEQGTGGNTPIGFGIEPSAKHMAICNRDANTVLASRIDAGNGRLKPSGVFASVVAPTCVKFLPPSGGG
jgi:6-phosphogluconolactonase